MAFTTMSLSPQESRVVLTLSERGQRETTRAEIVTLLGATPKAADHVIESLRHKGWLERASWGAYLLIRRTRGLMLWATAIFWRSPAESRIPITSASAPPPPITG